MSIFNVDTVQPEIDTMKQTIKAPHVTVQVSTLGGKERASILFNFSLDKKEEWLNGIFQNSRYSQFHLGYDGTLEQFSFCHKFSKKFRKTTVKTIQEAIEKVNKYIGIVQTA